MYFWREVFRFCDPWNTNDPPMAAILSEKHVCCGACEPIPS